MRIQDVFLLAYALFDGGSEALRQHWHRIQARRGKAFAHKIAQKTQGPLPHPWSDWQLLTAGGLIFSALIWLCFLPMMLQMEPMDRVKEGKQVLHHQQQSSPASLLRLPRSTQSKVQVKQYFSERQQQKLERMGAKRQQRDLNVESSMTSLVTQPILLNVTELKALIGTRRLAQFHQKKGKVVLRVLVDDKGQVLQHLVLKSPSPFYLSAVKSQLNQALFLPAIKEGLPTHRWTTIQFDFQP
ncbi:MAG: energy transducer TonB [Bacteroidota bacterium]